jgi:hypothetical protein
MAKLNAFKTPEADIIKQRKRPITMYFLEILN